ncbi:hypothetical protein [Paracoccus sp. R86501]|uniref:hypothetical protein n=1 Tax=Paracoccus sp. R86501 TaxID=3101711 RepID=UPI00366CFED0
MSSFEVDWIVGSVTMHASEGSSPENGQRGPCHGFVTFLNHKITFHGIDRPMFDVMKPATASGGFGF